MIGRGRSGGLTNAQQQFVVSLMSGGGVSGTYLNPSTYANLPSAAINDGKFIWCLDFGDAGALLRSNGTRWRPVGRVVMRTLLTLPTITGATAAIFAGASLLLPAGLIEQGGVLEIQASAAKDGTAGTALFNTRIGVAGTTSDAAVDLGGFSMATTAVNIGTTPMRFRRASATTTLKLGSAGVATGSNGASSTSATPAAQTVPDLDANAVYVSLSCVLTVATTETVTLREWTVAYIPPAT